MKNCILVMINEVTPVTLNNVELHNENSQEQLRALAKLVVVSALWHGMGLLDRKIPLSDNQSLAKSQNDLQNNLSDPSASVSITEKEKFLPIKN